MAMAGREEWGGGVGQVTQVGRARAVRRVSCMLAGFDYTSLPSMICAETGHSVQNCGKTSIGGDQAQVLRCC